MTTTFEQLILQVRSDIGDTYADNYTYADADMLRYAVQGVLDMWRVRPSLKYNPETGVLYDRDTVLPTAVDQLHYEVPVQQPYVPALEAYLMHRCLARDITDAGNAAAAKLYKDKYDQILAG